MADRIQAFPPGFGKGLALVAFLMALLLMASLALAHEASTGWKYDAYCCNERDCRQALPGEVQFTPRGWMIDGEVIPEGDERIRPSGDRMIHVCKEMQPHYDRKWRCLYLPKAEG